MHILTFPAHKKPGLRGLVVILQGNKYADLGSPLRGELSPKATEGVHIEEIFLKSANSCNNPHRPRFARPPPPYRGRQDPFNTGFLRIKNRACFRRPGLIASSYVVMLHLFATRGFPATPDANIRAFGPAWFVSVTSVHPRCSRRFRTSFSTSRRWWQRPCRRRCTG